MKEFSLSLEPFLGGLIGQKAIAAHLEHSVMELLHEAHSMYGVHLSSAVFMQPHRRPLPSSTPSKSYAGDA